MCVTVNLILKKNSSSNIRLNHMIENGINNALKSALLIIRTKFCNQFSTTHYMVTYKTIHMYFSHMTYLMSHVTSLNNACGWSSKLSRNKL